MEPKTKRILELARSQVVPPRDLVELGVPRSVLTELVANGALHKGSLQMLSIPVESDYNACG